MRAVVTGANRGIGLELVRQLLNRGDAVEACARATSDELAALTSPNLRLHTVDIAQPDTVAQLAQALGDTPIDVLFNVAGTYGGSRQSLRQMAEDLPLEDVLHTFDVNAAGALRMSVALLPHIRRGTAKKLVHITSGMGSIADNTTGGYYAYRMSKAALNMMSRCLAIDLRGEGIISVVINPGWVQTDMGGPSAPVPVGDSVRGILQMSDGASIGDTGQFLNWKGNRYPW